jgi:hypothetical protein
MAKKRKKSSKSNVVEVLSRNDQEATSLKDQTESLLSEFETARDSIIDSIGRSTTELRDIITDLTKNTADTSLSKMQGVVAEVENLGDRVLDDLNQGLASIKTSLIGETKPAKNKGTKGKSKGKKKKGKKKESAGKK